MTKIHAEAIIESRAAAAAMVAGPMPLTTAEYENRRHQLEAGESFITDAEREAVNEQFDGERTLDDMALELENAHRSYTGTIVNLNHIIERQADVIAQQKVIVGEAKRGQIRMIVCSVALIGISLWALSRGD
jgi:hypothetical protein